MTTQAEKAAAFERMHHEDKILILPNPWDRGSARLMEKTGHRALATTSAGYAFSRGKTDTNIGRAEIMDHSADLVACTDLPISADLENGFGHAPEDTAETIRQAAVAGLVGGSIEDSCNDGSAPHYEIAHAAERIEASADAAAALDFKFMLCARAENYLWGNTDLADVIQRLQAYQEAGADVLYAPGLTSADDIRSVISSVDRPVNVLFGMAGMELTAGELQEMGVARISAGGSIARAALQAMMTASEKMLAGDPAFSHAAISGKDVHNLLKD